jgi:hypothetical protein
MVEYRKQFIIIKGIKDIWKFAGQNRHSRFLYLRTGP